MFIGPLSDKQMRQIDEILGREPVIKTRRITWWKK
jgi:hypothetical protein